MKIILITLTLFLLNSSFAKEVTRFSHIKNIFERRCVGCHATNTTGILDFSDYKTSYSYKDQIYLRVVELKNMPLYTKMPHEERLQIKKWIEEGALE